MNYGSDPADQVVRYSLEGAEAALKLSGLAAKNFAVFAYAVLKDQKKTRGKTRLVRMLKEQRPLKFFTVLAEQMKDFAREAKKRGLLFVPIRSKQHPGEIEIAVFADDAAKVNRALECLKLELFPAGEAIPEQPKPEPEQASPEQPKRRPPPPREHSELPLPDDEPVPSESPEFDWSGFFAEPQPENFPAGQETASPSAPSSPSKSRFLDRGERQFGEPGERKSVRQILIEIRAALAQTMKSVPERLKVHDRER
ncbi:MAG: PcfB family protein [Oscillospiraceae bacterium]|jgi:hypothetical protein|nr:PcfB family protein [Oscillospiraceae bacterium]